MRVPRVTGFALALGLLTATTAGAAQQTVLGRGFAVRDPLPGVNPSKRSVVVAGRERPTDVTFVGDPLANGASLTVIANGGTSTSQTYTLPPGAYVEPPFAGWQVSTGATGTSAKYLDKLGTNGPVRVLRLKITTTAAVFKAIVDGKNGSVDVLPPDPGTDGGAIFTVTGGDAYCFAFGGAAGGVVKNAGNEAFKIVRPTAEGCPAAP
jgi:hypothetical protein